MKTGYEDYRENDYGRIPRITDDVYREWLCNPPKK